MIASGDRVRDKGERVPRAGEKSRQDVEGSGYVHVSVLGGPGRARWSAGLRRAGCSHLAPVGLVKRPVARCTHIRRRLEPAGRRHDVLAAIAIHVASTDAVSEKSRLTDDVLDPLAELDFVPCGRQVRRARELRQQLLRFPVVVQIHEKCKLRWSDRVDRIHRPRAGRCPWIPEPLELSREVADLHDVDVTVAIDVDGQVAEIVDVAGRSVDRAQRVLRPRGCFIPVLRGDDVRLAIVVQICDRDCLALYLVDGFDAERRIGWLRLEKAERQEYDSKGD